MNRLGMIRKTTVLLGAGVLVAGLAAPLAASADADDNAVAFLIGAVVGHSIDGDRIHAGHRRGYDHAWQVRKLHHPVYRHARHGNGWHDWNRWERGWQHGERRHVRHDRRHERCSDRHERRHERRDRRHDRRFHG